MPNSTTLFLLLICFIFAETFPLFHVIVGWCDLHFFSFHEGAGDFMEDLLHFFVFFCWALHIRHLFFLAKHGYFLFRYPPTVRQIWLIAHQYQHCIFLSVLFYFSAPEFADINKTLVISQIKHHKDCLAASIIGTSDSPETFLSRCVPNLKLHILIVDVGGLESKIDADGGEVMVLELIFCKPNEDRGFADSRIANDDCFVQVVELFNHFISRPMPPLLIILYVWFSINSVAV